MNNDINKGFFMGIGLICAILVCAFLGLCVCPLVMLAISMPEGNTINSR